MIKQILRVIFSKNGIPKILVSDNAPEFCDEDLNLWLEKKGINRIRHRHITSIEWVWGKNGADRYNGTESMFSAKRKNRFSTKAAF